jgi:hypothetical protein
MPAARQIRAVPQRLGFRRWKGSAPILASNLDRLNLTTYQGDVTPAGSDCRRCE